MGKQVKDLSFFHYHPELFGRLGLGILAGGFCLVLPLIFMLCSFEGVSPLLTRPKERAAVLQRTDFSLGLKSSSPVFPTFNLKNEMTLSFEPPHPLAEEEGKRLLVRMKHGADFQRVILPSRIGLEFQGKRLRFTEKASSFWIDLAAKENGQIELSSSIVTCEGETINVGTFAVFPEESPTRSASEFASGSPFAVLAAARSWGRDLLKEAEIERLEIGSYLLEVAQGNWLSWQDGVWRICQGAEKDKTIARVQSCNSKSVVLEGWSSDGYVRLAVPSVPASPFRIKGEELLSSIRIRSEKQISCALEKQCMILKTGDWVLKTGSKWKILRKKDERDALLSGKLFGELFVFEQIVQKQGQKMIQGRLFDSSRSQSLFVEMAAQSAKKSRGRLQ
jgi:hypothetical protein